MALILPFFFTETCAHRINDNWGFKNTFTPGRASFAEVLSLPDDF